MSAWRRTMRTLAMTDSGQTFAPTLSASCEILEISDFSGGRPLLTRFFLIELP